MPTHIFIQHGMWNEVANQNVRAFDIAKDLGNQATFPATCRTRATGVNMASCSSATTPGARERIRVFEEMATTTKHPRAVGALALMKARYIIETEEWKVQPVAENASAETIFANGLSALRTGDMETATEDGSDPCRQSQGDAGRDGRRGGGHADHGARRRRAAPGGGDAGQSVRIVHRSWPPSSRWQGAEDRAVALLKEAVKIEEGMRPPNGAADPD